MTRAQETLICSISFVIGLILIANGLASLYWTSEPSSNNASKTSAVPVATLTPTQLTTSIPAITQNITPEATKVHPSNWLVTHKKEVLLGKVCSDCHQPKFCADCHDTTAKSSKAPYKEEHVWDGSKPDKFSLTYTWNPISSDALYDDVGRNMGNESLTIILDSYSDRNIQEGTLKYFTSPNTISFNYSQWGSYNVIGFLAEKYFAGYTTGVTNMPISAISNKQLNKVLTDDNTQRAVYAGSTQTLNEGYVLKVKKVDITRGKIVLLQLLKDGGEVDNAAIEAGNTYVYNKKVGLVSNLPIIAVHIETVLSGREGNFALIKGIFQISESYTSVNLGDRNGIMEITEFSDASIAMVNKDSFTLSPGSIVDVMGNIKIKIEDSNDVRFYPFVMVDENVAAANQLVIDAPLTPRAGDTIIITVTVSRNAISDAAVSLDNTQIGTTDSTGKLNYALTISGVHNITATKLGYEKAVKTIYVSG